MQVKRRIRQFVGLTLLVRYMFARGHHSGPMLGTLGPDVPLAHARGGVALAHGA